MKKYIFIFTIVFLSACSLPKKPAEKFIQDSVIERFDKSIIWWDGDHPPADVQTKVRRLLEEPLTAPTLFEVALLNSYELQINLARLGEQHAQAMQTALLANPEIEITAFDQSQEFELTWSLTRLLSLSARIDRADAVFEEAQYAALEKLIERLYAIYDQWLLVVASQQKLGIEVRTLDAMEASKVSTEEIHRVGNTTDLALYSANINYSLSEVRFHLIEQNYRSELRKLALMLGVDVDRLLVPDTLPKIPSKTIQLDGIEAKILENNLKLQRLAKQEKALHAAHSQNQTERFVHDVEAGPVYERSDGEGEFGAQVDLAIPILDTGGTRAAAIRHALRKTRLQLNFQKKKLQLTTTNAVEDMRLSRKLVEKLLDEVTPDQINLETESMKSYNGMQLGIFGLLNYHKQGNERRSGFVDMLHQYWQNRARIEAMTAGITLEFSKSNVSDTGSDNSQGEH